MTEENDLSPPTIECHRKLARSSSRQHGDVPLSVILSGKVAFQVSVAGDPIDPPQIEVAVGIRFQHRGIGRCDSGSDSRKGSTTIKTSEYVPVLGCVVCISRLHVRDKDAPVVADHFLIVTLERRPVNHLLIEAQELDRARLASPDGLTECNHGQTDQRQMRPISVHPLLLSDSTDDEHYVKVDFHCWRYFALPLRERDAEQYGN